MNDGGGGGDCSNGSLKEKSKKEEFAHSLARIAVAQICESVGLHGFQQSAGDVLSDVMCKYIQDIGKMSNFYANLAGRTECNVFDIIHALEDLELPSGFVGASDIDRCLSESGVIKEISQYVGVSEEVGFAYSVPHFPVIMERELTPSFFRAGETPPVDSIPSWLPCFTDPKTFAISTSSVEQIDERNVDQGQKVLEPPVLKPEQLLTNNGFKSTIVELGISGGSEKVCNAFLAPVLQYGEKDVALVSLPARLVEDDVAQNHNLWTNDVSALGTCVPVFQDVKSSVLDNDEGVKKVDVLKRPALQFKFHTSKKYLAAEDRHRKIRGAEGRSWFENDDLMDDKKNRKENIVTPSENGTHAVVN
ncbi:uncharacterized protein [Rutidosis leptorrhynchoides]|uniref:uncharacterized protein n=1 Tax=Rutidosis leptorrhynchoides TaxID=125765 RepID=UPI003A98EACB